VLEGQGRKGWKRGIKQERIKEAGKTYTRKEIKLQEHREEAMM
jgi:hypothetical protein